MDASLHGADLEIPPFNVWCSKRGPVIRVADSVWWVV